MVRQAQRFSFAGSVSGPPNWWVRHSFRRKLGQAFHASASGHVALIDGDYVSARACFERSLAAAEGIDFFGLATEAQLLIAWLCLELNDDLSNGAQHLNKAIDRFVETGYVTPLKLLGEPVLSSLLNSPYATGLSAMHHKALASVAEQTQKGADVPRAMESLPNVEHVESISTREMEVLELIAAGQSNKHIARALDLSPHTVKRHVANILGKLGAVSRGEAAAKLRAMRD
jgi:LuxR family transcriptional regulator, maltose regulon positive regulatory protein